MSYYVPTDLLSEILLRVPAESLARFRCTCKAWRLLIDDHRFLKLHIRRQQRDGELHIITVVGDTNPKYYTMPLSSFTCYLENPIIKAKILSDPIMSSTLIPLSPSDTFRLPMPSCDGFILICRTYIGSSWGLYNPFLRDYHQLPPWPETKPTILPETSGGYRSITRGGFGYDSVHDDYKVLMLSWYYTFDILTTSIYSLKSNEWHRIEDYPNCDRYGRYDNGVFFNGAVYWIVYIKLEDGKYKIRILALDLSTENYHHLPLPTGITGKHSWHLDSLSGRFFFSQLGREGMDVWIMQNGGENVVWTKFLSIGHLVTIQNFKCVNLMAYEKSKEKIAIIYNHDKAFWYDLVKKCAIEIPLEGPRGVIICKAIPASLLRLTAYQEGRLCIRNESKITANNAAKVDQMKKKKRKPVCREMSKKKQKK